MYNYIRWLHKEGGIDKQVQELLMGTNNGRFEFVFGSLPEIRFGCDISKLPSSTKLFKVVCIEHSLKLINFTISMI